MIDNGLVTADGVAYNHFALVRVLCTLHKGLKVFHFNGRSLNGHKLDYVRYIFERGEADVICVSETWFKPDVPDSFYSIPKYRMYRHDRYDRRGGGVAIYCIDNLQTRIVSKSINFQIEYLNIEIIGRVKMLVSCVYNPHRQYSLSPFFTDLNERAIDSDFYVACGDFNVNILINDTINNSLKNMIADSGLTIVNTDITTRYDKNHIPSLIDLFLVSDPSGVVNYDQINFISDHDLTFCCLNC